MKKKDKVITLLLLSVFGLSMLTACANKFEGTGSKKAADAQQLAQRLPDPWKKEISSIREKMEGEYRNGTYSGIGQGMDGWIRVQITIKDNRLTVDAVQQEGETQSVGGYEAVRDGIYAAQIEAAQGPKIDGLSGATITTYGVIGALNDALAKAQ
ncbi:FMN-binding protein [Treponema sp.]|uniref:FMN-binding protein n=1 Tax=Treponema sp. TaxID=166 RepID=UPI003FA25333